MNKHSAVKAPNETTSLQNKETHQQLWVDRIVSLAAFLLIALPVGMACIVLGFGLGDNPCILCWEERIIMILSALIAIFIMRYGMKPRYIGALIFTALYGLWAGFRHSSGHLLKDIGQGFGPAILGLHTYVWVMVVFALILLFGAILLICQGDCLPEKKNPQDWYFRNRITVIVFQVVVLFNIVQAVTQVGPVPFIGQGDPYRMSLNPHKITWSMAHWPTLSSFSFNRKFSLARPDFSQAANQVKSTNQTQYWQPTKVIALSNQIQGVVTGISYQPESQLVALVTNDNWVYFYNRTMDTQLAAVNIDGAFSVEVSNLADITFDGLDTVLVTTDHKTYVRLRYDPSATLDEQFWLFRAGTDGVRELKRAVFATVRSKYNYVGSLTWDTQQKEYVMVSLPNEPHHNFVIMRLSGEDYQLNSEKKVSIESDNYPQVTGVALYHQGAYLLAQNTQQILWMDKHHQIQVASDIELKNPQGLTIMDNQLLVIDGAQGENQVYFYALNE